MNYLIPKSLALALSALLLYLLIFKTASGQPISLEAMAGNRYLFYQHTISKRLGDHSRFHVKHIANVIARYNHNPESGGLPNEIMNQAYLGYRLMKNFALMSGGFYTKATDLRPSIAIEYVVKKKDVLLVLVPRADMIKNGTYDLMALIEYKPKLSDHFHLYTRLQCMSNHSNAGHNRGYQQLRAGLSKNAGSLGLAMNIDQYGKGYKTFYNLGFFIKREIN